MKIVRKLIINNYRQMLMCNYLNPTGLVFSILPTVLRVPEDIGSVGLGGRALSVALVSGSIAEGIVVILTGSTNDDGPQTTATGK